MKNPGRFVRESKGRLRRWPLAVALGCAILSGARTTDAAVATPQLDKLAEDGVRLTQFYTMARCCPSRASILTGQYPHRVGLGHMTQDIDQPGYRGRVSEEARTIAQALAPAGYRSFLAGKWHLGTPDPTLHGFEEFYGTLTSAQRFFDPDHFIRLPADRKRIEYPDGGFYGTDAVTDHALEFLGQARTTPPRPWFLYLAYNAPHFPLQAPVAEIARYRERYQGGWDELRRERLARMKQLGIVPGDTELTPRSPWWNFGETGSGVNPPWESLPEDRRRDSARRMAIYAAMVDRLDQQVGRVVDDLKAHGELKNTLILFFSDNGACAEWDPRGFDLRTSNNNILHTGDEFEKMGGPGTYHSVGSGWANASNAPWRLYKHFSHEGGINSPLIMHWPAGLGARAGAIVHAPAHVIDVMATAVAVAQADYSGPLDLPGTDLTAVARDEEPLDRTLFFEHEGHRAVRAGRWKLVALREHPWELYDFAVIRTEQDDMAAQHPEIVADLARRWDQWAEANHVTPLPRDYRVPYLRKPEAVGAQ